MKLCVDGPAFDENDMPVIDTDSQAQREAALQQHRTARMAQVFSSVLTDILAHPCGRSTSLAGTLTHRRPGGLCVPGQRGHLRLRLENGTLYRPH